MVEQIEETAVSADNFLYSGTHWQVSHADYQKLLEESEYAAWMAAWGYRANHFTVSVNLLTQFETIQEVNQALKNAGFVLNTSGGEMTALIKKMPTTSTQQKKNYLLTDRKCFVFFELSGRVTLKKN